MKKIFKRIEDWFERTYLQCNGEDDGMGNICLSVLLLGAIIVLIIVMIN